MVTQHLYYCCADTIKVFAVNILPSIPGDSPDRVRIHDVDRPPKAWYTVDAARVKLTKAEAIWAAKEDLDQRDSDISQEMKDLQDQRDEISHLLECGDPDNDGT